MTSLRQYIVVFFWGNVPTYLGKIHIDISVAHSKQFAKKYKLIYKNMDWPCIFFHFNSSLKRSANSL